MGGGGLGKSAHIFRLFLVFFWQGANTFPPYCLCTRPFMLNGIPVLVQNIFPLLQAHEVFRERIFLLRLPWWSKFHFLASSNWQILVQTRDVNNIISQLFFALRSEAGKNLRAKDSKKTFLYFCKSPIHLAREKHAFFVSILFVRKSCSEMQIAARCEHFNRNI